jgi:hypothetical protein
MGYVAVICYVPDVFHLHISDPRVLFDGVATGLEHLALVKVPVLSPFDKGWAILFDWAHVFIIHMNHFQGKF